MRGRLLTAPQDDDAGLLGGRSDGCVVDAADVLHHVQHQPRVLVAVEEQHVADAAICQRRAAHNQRIYIEEGFFDTKPCIHVAVKEQHVVNAAGRRRRAAHNDKLLNGSLLSLTGKKA